MKNIAFFSFIIILFFNNCTQSKTSNPTSDINFQNFSQTSGINTQTSTFGAGAWGDYNQDGFPDLWLGNHASHPSLFINQGDGTFIDMAPIVVQFNRDPYTIDAHGAQWVDIDRDGDQDLVEMTGGRRGKGAEPSLIWINQNGTLTDHASLLGLTYPRCRGRTPLAHDWNNDGWLDLLMTCVTNPAAPSAIFTNQTTHFSPLTANKAFRPPPASQYGQLYNPAVDNAANIYIQSKNGGIGINTSTTPWQSNYKTNQRGIVDSVFVDIDGDLTDDKIYIKQEGSNLISDAAEISDNTAQLSLLTNKGSLVITKIKTTGNLTISIRSNPLGPHNIYIGAAGIVANTFALTLQPTDPSVVGIAAYTPNVDTGLYVGFNPATSIWTIAQTSTQYTPVACKITSSSSLRIAEKIGFEKVRSSLILHTSRSPQTQLNIPFGTSIVAADFDNDMDQDIYLVRSRLAKNLPNILLVNNGKGLFTEFPANVSGSLTGIGDAASTVDYNNDGLIDLFVTNGAGNKELSMNGQVQMFKNVSKTTNHWLAINLRGTTSNLDGIGATIKITAGGITQIRHQYGGMHKHTQNHSRIHFGLGIHKSISTLSIAWPSGKKEFWSNIATNQILNLTEGTGAPLP